MSSPRPPVELQEPCSVIVGDILYVYTPDAFQSLSLKRGGTWSRLASGVSVSGAVCVKTTDGAAASGDALWVIGGTTNSSVQGYTGLQKYSFSSKTWKTIKPLVTVTENRVNHAATYLELSSALLVYAGHQTGGNVPSIETFLIDTTPPFNVQSFTSQNLPVISPLLLPWDQNSAITLGGAELNDNIYFFSPNAGWGEYDTKLQTGLKSSSAVQAALVTASDNSKVLELYDMSVSPNNCTQLVLQDPTGQPAPTGEEISQQDGNPGSKKRKRGLTLKDWPEYNAKAAPTQIRSGMTLAQSSNGLAVLVGGNPQYPIAIFNQESNAWVNTTQFFGPHDIGAPLPLVSNTSPTPSATSTSTNSPASTGSAGSGGLSDKTRIILGAVLGGVLGAIVLLLCCLILMRWRRNKKKKPFQKSYVNEKRLSFADRGDPHMKEAGGSVPFYDGSKSHSSLAIMSGRAVKTHRPHASDSSTANLVRKSPLGVTEPVEMHVFKERDARLIPRIELPAPNAPATELPQYKSSGYLQLPKRSSGWSRYFSGVTTGHLTTDNLGQATASGNLQASQNTSQHSRGMQDGNTSGTTEIPPLKFGQQNDGQRLSSVASGSPRMSFASDNLGRKTSQRGRLDDRPDTASSMNSSQPSSTMGETIFTHDPGDTATHSWTPVSRSDWLAPQYNRDTTSSSVYGQSFRSSDYIFSKYPSQLGGQNYSNTMQSEPRASNITLWPRTAETADPELRQSSYALKSQMKGLPTRKPVATDMSWVNLHAGTSPR